MSDNQLYLTYILDSISDIEDLTANGRAAFESDRHKRAAALYYLQTMAESTQHLSEPLKIRHPEVDWVAISGFRNRLVHGYLDVNMDIVWNVIEKHIPELKRAINIMLSEPGAR